jgi:hypothetical protein
MFFFVFFFPYSRTKKFLDYKQKRSDPAMMRTHDVLPCVGTDDRFIELVHSVLFHFCCLVQNNIDFNDNKTALAAST